jgi:hypothetical protein
MVVGRGAYATAGEDDVAGREGAFQGVRDPFGLVAHVLGPTELQAAGGQQLDQPGQVLVGALAGEDLVADDDEADVRAVWRGHPAMLAARGSPPLPGSQGPDPADTM